MLTRYIYLYANIYVVSEKYKGKLRQQDGELLDEEDDESDSEEEDEEGVKDKPEWDNEFLKLLPKISKRDPEIYQPKEFFPAGNSRILFYNHCYYEL